jgi:CDP-diacylglycerol--serine O-phosphatidyltransferase
MDSTGKRAKKLPLHKMIPNIITLAALSAGMTSIKFAIAHKWEEAVIAIFAAALMDAFDGAAARLLKAQSKLGAELDSFSDFICFGVAPAIVIYLWALEGVGKWGWPVALIFAIAVALRLSRFNIATDEGDPNDPLTKYFTGVPSPVGALLSFFPMVVSFQSESAAAAIASHPALLGAWMVIVAAMMVSNIPTFSSKQIRIPVRMKVPALALFGILIASLLNNLWPTMTLIGVAYLFSLPFGLMHYQRRKRAAEQGTRDTDDDE